MLYIPLQDDIAGLCYTSWYSTFNKGGGGGVNPIPLGCGGGGTTMSNEGRLNGDKSLGTRI